MARRWAHGSANCTGNAVGKHPHTITYPGKRVRVVLKTGDVFVAKFRERTAKKVLHFDDHAPVDAGDVKAFTIWRNPIGVQMRLRK